MNIKTVDIAHALISVSASLTAQQMKHECDSAIALVKMHSPGTPLRVLKSRVTTLLRRREMCIPATLRTPTGHAGPAAATLMATAQSALHATVELTEHADAALIGGAVLRVGDERMDRSVSGALTTLHRTLTTTPLSVAA